MNDVLREIQKAIDALRPPTVILSPNVPEGQGLYFNFEHELMLHPRHRWAAEHLGLTIIGVPPRQPAPWTLNPRKVARARAIARNQMTYRPQPAAASTNLFIDEYHEFSPEQTASWQAWMRRRDTITTAAQTRAARHAPRTLPNDVVAFLLERGWTYNPTTDGTNPWTHPDTTPVLAEDSEATS